MRSGFLALVKATGFDTSLDYYNLGLTVEMYKINGLLKVENE
jgi:hypothetical protein